MAQPMISAATVATAPKLTLVPARNDLPPWTNRDAIASFLHEHLKPYEDTLSDVRRGLDDALENRPAPGGFVLLARLEARLAGALVMLRTGMTGYVSENLLLFVAVDRALRGHGIGGLLVRSAVDRCAGDVKLHVEHDNPAKRLYERVGFSSKYAEMRFRKAART